MSPVLSPSCSLPSKVPSYCSSPPGQPSLGFWLLPAMAQKAPLKTTFLSRVCIFLPFQPFLPSLQYFQPLTFSSHGSVFQSQAAEQAQGIISTPLGQAPCHCRISPVLGLTASSPRHVTHLFQLNYTGFSPSPHSLSPRLRHIPISLLAAPAHRHSQRHTRRSWHKDGNGSLCQLAGPG